MQEKKIYVVDAPMGAGKTSAALNYIRDLTGDERVLFVTPYLDEVRRVKRACRALHICEPRYEDGKTKTDDLLRLLGANENVATTHALFLKLTAEEIEVLRGKRYTLIVDEEVQLCEPMILDSGTVAAMKLVTERRENGSLLWNDELTAPGVLADWKMWCKRGELHPYGDNRLMMEFPFAVFASFNKVILMTYLFDSQRQCMYFRSHGCSFEHLYVRRGGQSFWFTAEPQPEVFYPYKRLMRVWGGDTLNEIGEERCALSKNWYVKEFAKKDHGGVRLVRGRVNTFIRRRMHAKSKQVMWTVFRDYQGAVVTDGLARGFVPCNARATNKYQNCDVLAYPVNIFMDPGVELYFKERGVEIDPDAFALSMMLQWIWRSAVRNGKHITIYIPSKRMRTMLLRWLDEQQKLYEDWIRKRGDETAA